MLSPTSILFKNKKGYAFYWVANGTVFFVAVQHCSHLITQDISAERKCEGLSEQGVRAEIRAIHKQE